MKDLTAKSVMTTDVKVAESSWSVQHLAEFLIEHSISGAPVVDDDGRLAGVVSLTDIVRHDTIPGESAKRSSFYQDGDGTFYSSQELSGFRVVNEDRVTVGEIMTPVVYKVPENASLIDVADDMIRGQIHRVLVTQGRELVGIISALDMLKAIRNVETPAGS